MQENDFEKQVHQKMGELKMLPSETVWEQVEMRLHKKDKRRGWLLWLPLLMAGLFLPAYFVFFNGHPSLSKQQQNPANSFISQPSTVTAGKNINTGKAGNLNNATPGTALPSPSQQAPEPVAPQHSTILKANISRGLIAGTTHASPFIPTRGGNHLNTTPAGELVSSTAKNGTVAKTSVPTSRQNVNPGETDQSIDKATTTAGNTFTNTLADTASGFIDQQFASAIINGAPAGIATINITTPLISSQALPVVNPKNMHQKGWEWGLTFAGGKSSITNGAIHSLFGAGSGAFASPSQGNLNNGASANSGYIELYPTRGAAGFSAGVFVKKKISSRFSLSAGLEYSQLTTTNTTGKKVDSAILINATFLADRQYVGSYFRLGNTGSFTSRYHYLQVPVILQTNLARSWRHPLYWDLGMTVSRLIASNALHFDNTSGVYYKNNSLINKTQFNMVTGFPVELLSRGSFGLQAGPELQYGFSKAGKYNNGSSKHFVFISLKAAMVIGKK